MGSPTYLTSSAVVTSESQIIFKNLQELHLIFFKYHTRDDLVGKAEVWLKAS